MSSELETALAADRAMRRRAAAQAISVTGGLAVRHAGLHDVHFLNAVLLDAGGQRVTGAEAAVLAESHQGDLDHRHVVFDDAGAGERAAVELQDAGWERGRTVFMAFPRDAAAVHQDARARAISEAEMDALQLANLRDETPEAQARGGVAGRLLDTQRRLRATTPSRCFGAGEPGEELASMCTLYLDPDVDGRRVAMVTEVGTRVARRERGLGRAVVSAAVAHADGWRADLIMVGADADDWPQLMYVALGFAPIGRQVTLTWRVRAVWAGSESVSGGV